MMQRLVITLVVCLLLIGEGFAQTSTKLSTYQKRVASEQISLIFRSQIWENPIMKGEAYSFDSHEVGIEYFDKSSTDAAFIQKGNSNRHYQFRALSFLPLSSSSTVYGSASYKNGKTEGVNWNENADYDIIYPYVVGDSLGSYMKKEVYAFSGGYIHKFRSWQLTAGVDYRAMTSYRDKDPRPKNVVSDMTLQLGMAHPLLHRRYLLSLLINYRTYSQNSSISFMADKGRTAVYQMLGLGVDYVRFAGDEYFSRYKGSGVGATIDFLPYSIKSGNGLTCSLSGNYFHLTKELSNANSAPINELSLLSSHLELGYSQQLSVLDYGVKLVAAYEKRVGRENLFGDPTGASYPKIGSNKQFYNTTLGTALSGVLRYNTAGDSYWQIEPTLGYSSLHPEYKAIHRSFKVNNYHLGLSLAHSRRFKKVKCHLSAASTFTSNVSHEQQLPGLNRDTSVGQTLLSNIDFLKDQHLDYHIGLHTDYYYSDKMAYFLNIDFTQQIYKQHKNNNILSLSLGVFF